MSDQPILRFFGSMLVAVGALIATLSGLCSVTLIAPAIIQVLSDPSTLGNVLSGAPLVAIIGGLPFLLGVALIVGGRALMGVSKPPPPASADKPEAQG